MTPAVVYALCALTSFVCAALLLRAYNRTRTRLLLWSSISFVGLAANNILLFVDLVMVPSIDLSILRASIGLLSVMILLFGLAWEEGG